MSSETIMQPDSSSSRTESLNSTDSESLNTLYPNKEEEKKRSYAALQNVEKKKGRVCCNSLGQLLWGVFFIILSIGGLVFTPQDAVLWEKLNMRPGFPPYEWWADPPDEVRLRVYVFNITNHERFLQGLDEKLNVQEVGPIVYLEKLLHYNISFNCNDTMSYTARRFPIYLPEENTINLNSSLIVANLAVLGIASHLHDANYFVRTGFSLLASTHSKELFLKRTIQEYLWDFRDPVLQISKNLVPGLVPVDNMGMLARIYADFVDEITVKIGPKWGHDEFFQIDRFRGNPQLPGYSADKCPDRLFGATEGVMYQQRLTKQDVLLYWRKTVCRVVPLYFESEFTLDSVPVYRYNLSENVYDRIRNGTDCYDTEPSLVNGISDCAKCYFDFPMVVSYPHFYTGSPKKDYYVTGLQPDRFKHNSYVIVEPLTGTPFQSVARMQSNLRIHDLSHFSRQYQRMSNLVLPLFWAEYNQEGLPSHIKWTIFFITRLLPPVSIVIISLCILLGLYFITKNIPVHKMRKDSLKSFMHLKSRKVNTLAKNTILSYEKEVFLKISS